MTTENQAESAGETLLDIDHSVHEAVRKKPTSKAMALLGKASDLGDQPPLRLICAGMVLTGAVRRDPRMVLAGLRMLAAHELATVVKKVIKDRVDRTRPRSADDKQEERPQPGQDKDKEESSFPSGHSAGAMAVGSALASVYPTSTLPALTLAGGVSIMQIPRRAHYPTDVVAGMAIGVAANGIVGLVWRLAARIVRLGIAKR